MRVTASQLLRPCFWNRFGLITVRKFILQMEVKDLLVQYVKLEGPDLVHQIKLLLYNGIPVVEQTTGSDIKVNMTYELSIMLK